MDSSDERDGAAGRRQVLRGVLVGAAGLAAGTLAAGPPAAAADGDPLLVGRIDNDASSETRFTGPTFTVIGDSGSAALHVQTNVRGSDAILGNADGNGVHGFSVSDTASGVYGENLAGGYGVAGRAAEGTGVLADSANGIALDVIGLARFSRCGLATVSGSSGTPLSNVKVRGYPLTGFDLILTTPQTHLGGIWVAAAVPNTRQQTFTIYLNKTVTVPYKIGFMIVQTD